MGKHAPTPTNYKTRDQNREYHTPETHTKKEENKRENKKELKKAKLNQNNKRRLQAVGPGRLDPVQLNRDFLFEREQILSLPLKIISLSSLSSDFLKFPHCHQTKFAFLWLPFLFPWARASHWPSAHVSHRPSYPRSGSSQQGHVTRPPACNACVC